MTGVLIRRQHVKTKAHREHVTWQGRRRLDSHSCKSLKAGRRKNLLAGLKGAQCCQHLDFGLLQKQEIVDFCKFLNHQFIALYYSNPKARIVLRDYFQGLIRLTDTTKKMQSLKKYGLCLTRASSRYVYELAGIMKNILHFDEYSRNYKYLCIKNLQIKKKLEIFKFKTS